MKFFFDCAKYISDRDTWEMNGRTNMLVEIAMKIMNF